MVLEAHVKSEVDYRTPLILSSSQTFWSIWRQYGKLSPRYLKRLTYIALGTIGTYPLQLIEQLCYNEAIRQTQVTKPPVFIIGHWRSGTTLLHYMMARDPRFGIITTQQGIFPAVYLLTRTAFSPLMPRVLPKDRMVDKMIMHADLPMEDEIPLSCTSPFSYYHCLNFPSHMQSFYQRFGNFEQATPTDISQWKDAYLRVLKTATITAGQKPLLLKNPINTSRIPQILSLFPEAKFIYLYRDPYRVFLSMRHFLQHMLSRSQLEDISLADIETNVLSIYHDMVTRYERDKAQIPDDNLFEYSFERFTEDPVLILEAMYQRFGWQFTPERRADYIEYWDKEVDFQQNEYSISPSDIAKINAHWSDIIDLYGYETRKP